LQPGFPTKDPVRVSDVLSKFPLYLWEEICNTALRDIEVGRFRSGIMHACLGVESYIRSALALNVHQVPDKRFLNKTLKPLATRKSCLPSLLGYSLDSNAAPSAMRECYQKIATLRDAVMHTGSLSYEWPLGSASLTDVSTPAAVADHVDMALSLVSSIAEALQQKGLQSGNRGMVAKAVLRE
jgi:hypothetical protein